LLAPLGFGLALGAEPDAAGRGVLALVDGATEVDVEGMALVVVLGVGAGAAPPAARSCSSRRSQSRSCSSKPA
jgi:hypothetical protein